MTIGNKKYTEPSAVLQSVIDEFGQKVQIGEEKDINEFKSILISRIADAFNHGKPEKEEGDMVPESPAFVKHKSEGLGADFDPSKVTN
jgi:hypothetical protein